MPTVLILGATSDIGLAIARKFAAKGHDIQLAGRDVTALKAIASDTAARFQVKAGIHPFDASDIAGHDAFYRNLDPLPDVTVYAIGYMTDNAAALTHWEETERTITANYTGAVSILNRIAGGYAARKNGTIVGISSVAGERGRQSNFLYGSAKAAFTAYLSGLRNYLFPLGVHVLTVKPGFVYTKMTEQLKLPAPLTATPEQVANAVFAATNGRKNTLYVKSPWRWIMLLIRNIPESMFKKMKL
jgi:decaprenylphospho-beta-D-erythro-pentofuranosid-2-ulose 2-reductase